MQRFILLFLISVAVIVIGVSVINAQVNHVLFAPLVFNEGIDILAGQSITSTATLTPTVEISPTETRVPADT